MSNSQKTPFSVSINRFTNQRIQDALNGLGQVLPCYVTQVNGAIVTVNFSIDDANNGLTYPSVTCATIGSKYIRTPIQIGDEGVCIAATARLGGITGLGLGNSPITTPTNLGALIFVPIGNINWETLNADAVVISAPDGAIIQTDDGLSSVIISETEITLKYGPASIVLSSGGISITGILTINGLPFVAHTHGGVTTGSGVSGGVV